MQKITHENAVQELLKNIPELNTYRQFDEDELNSPTIIFDVFGDFLLDRIKSQTPGDDTVVARSFGFINEMMNSSIPEVQNLPVVGVFEVLAGSKIGIAIAERHLNESGLEWLHKVMEHFDAQ
jgi:hypothetical protein